MPTDKKLNKQDYSQPPLSIEKLVERLKDEEHNIKINDENQAKEFLYNNGYSIISQCYYEILKEMMVSHSNQPIEFDEFIKLRKLDMDISYILFDVLRDIELKFRARFFQKLSEVYEEYWIYNYSIYKSNKMNDSVDVIEAILKTSKKYEQVKHFKSKYNSKFTSWTIQDACSFGDISRILLNLSYNPSGLSNIDKQNAKIIDDLISEFGFIKYEYLNNVFQKFVKLRNKVSHYNSIVQYAKIHYDVWQHVISPASKVNSKDSDEDDKMLTFHTSDTTLYNERRFCVVIWWLGVVISSIHDNKARDDFFDKIEIIINNYNGKLNVKSLFGFDIDIRKVKIKV